MELRRHETRCMASPLRLSCVGGSERDSTAVRDAAWREMDATEADLSRFKASSALSTANGLAGSGDWFDAPDRLRGMLAVSHRAWRMTDGRFDPRVITILEEIGENAGVPLPATWAAGERWLERDGRRARFRLSAPVDSGGIGKGLGLRWALAAARRASRTAAGLLLDAGGDVVVSGPGPDGGPWSIGVEDPSRSGELLATVALREGAIATSSVAIRSWTHDGRQVHHLIDPRTGAPAETGLQAVTVALPDPAWAEVWTKALFLAGRAAIGDEARARGLAAWWVEEDGSLHMTPAAREQTTWVRHEANAA
jgi:thiamine biosynthesis lipoprotein